MKRGGPIHTTVGDDIVYDEIGGGYVYPKSAYAVLYTWPDGFRVLRRLSRVHTGYGLDIVDLILKDPAGDSVSSLNFDQAVNENDKPESLTYALGTPRRALEGWRFVGRWVAFGIDMLLLSDIDLRGRWGVLETPYRDEASREAWFDIIPWGTPTVELDLEPYALLDVYSPILWPLDAFEDWWAQQEAIDLT